MPAPTPNVATPLDLLDLPAGNTYTFNGSGSTPGVTYSWQLVEYPPEATGISFTNTNTATPTLSGITARGTYIVFLKVENSFGISHEDPYPVQATTEPYGFSIPLTSAFGVLRIAEAGSDPLNPIFKPGRGEYGWFEKGLWPLVKKVSEGLTFEYYDIPTRTLTANSIVPDASVSPFATAVSVAGLNVRNDSANSEHELYNVYDKINVLSNMHVTGKDLTVSGGLLKVDEIRDASGGALVLAPNGGLTVNTTDFDVTADHGATITMAGSLSETLALTSNGILQLQADAAIQIQAQDDGTISLTTNNGLISVYGTSLALEADADIDLRVGSTSLICTSSDLTLAATDDITLNAVDDINLNTTGATGQIKLTASGANGAVTLEPTIDTTTTKPLRAPGLVICETAQNKADTTFVAGNLFDSVPEYTRYSAGSDLDTTIGVAAYAPKDAAIELLLKRTANGSTTTFATINTGPLAVAGWCLFNIRCRTKITKDGHTLTVLSYDSTGVGTIDTPTTPGTTTTTYTLRSESFTGPVSFQVYSSETLGQFSAQMTCAMYNPHNEDVL
jgi:hypothetical protein